MSAVSTRDALAKVLPDALHAADDLDDDATPEDVFIAVADALITSGAVVDVGTLADDEALVEAIAADQKEAADSWGDPLPGAERKLRARTALRALVHTLSERTS